MYRAAPRHRRMGRGAHTAEGSARYPISTLLVTRPPNTKHSWAFVTKGRMKRYDALSEYLPNIGRSEPAGFRVRVKGNLKTCERTGRSDDRPFRRLSSFRFLHLSMSNGITREKDEQQQRVEELKGGGDRRGKCVLKRTKDKIVVVSTCELRY